MSEISGKNKKLGEKFCADCGKIINEKAEICPKCGVRQMYAPTSSLVSVSPNGRNKVVAALLALFFGWLGVHKFYLGHPTVGMIYLLFCWTFIPAILAFLEFIAFLMISNEDFNKKYGGA